MSGSPGVMGRGGFDYGLEMSRDALEVLFRLEEGFGVRPEADASGARVIVIYRLCDLLGNLSQWRRCAPLDDDARRVSINAEMRVASSIKCSRRASHHHLCCVYAALREGRFDR